MSRLELALNNQNRATVVDDVALNMILPPGVQIAATPQASAAGCGTITISAAAASNTLSLAGARIGRGEQCLIGVNLTASGVGNYTISTGLISSSNRGTSAGASAVLQVAKPMFKRFLPFIRR